MAAERPPTGGPPRKRRWGWLLRALLYTALAGLIAGVFYVRWVFLSPDPNTAAGRTAATLDKARWDYWWATKRVTHPCGIQAVLLPPGTAQLGHPADEQVGRVPVGRLPVREFDPQTPYTQTELVYVGTHEVTQAQYERVMGTNPSLNKGEHLRVERVTWEDALRFCRKLGRAGRPDLAAADRGGVGVRLPRGHHHAVPHRRDAVSRPGELRLRGALALERRRGRPGQDRAGP